MTNMRLWLKAHFVGLMLFFVSAVFTVSIAHAAHARTETQILSYTEIGNDGVTTTRFADVTVGTDGQFYAVGAIHRIFIEEYGVVATAAKVLDIDDPDFRLWAVPANPVPTGTAAVISYETVPNGGTIQSAMLETTPSGVVPGWNATRADQHYSVSVTRTTAMSITFKADVQIAEVPGVAGRVIKSLVVTWGNPPSNNAPVCTNKSYSVDSGQLLVVGAPGLLAGATDVDGDGLGVVIHATPAYDAHFNPNLATGAFEYRSNAGFVGSDVFLFRVYDGKDQSGICSVTIDVNSTEPAPIARDDQATTTANVAVLISVLANDSNVSSITAVGTPNSGTAQQVGSQIRYTPATNFTGTDTFTYTGRNGAGATDQATVTVTVNPSTSAFVCDVSGMPTRITEDVAYSGRMMFTHPLKMPIGLVNSASQVWQWFTPVVDNRDVRFDGVFPDPGTFTFQIEGTSQTDNSRATCSATVTVEAKSSTCNPGSVALLQPVDGGACHVGAVTLKWSGSVCAIEYQLQVSSSPTFNASTTYIDKAIVETQYSFDLPVAGSRFWRVREKNSAGEYGPWSETRHFQRCTSTSTDRSGVPAEFSLGENYPNPFNPSTTFEFDLPVSGEVTVQVLDILGRVVWQESRDLGAAYGHQMTVRLENQPSGVYLYQVMSGGKILGAGKMMLVK